MFRIQANAGRSRRARSALMFAALVAVPGCKKPEETLIERASEGKVKLDQDKQQITVETKKGTVTAQQRSNGLEAVVTDEKGDQVTMTATDKGLRVTGKDGSKEWATGKLPQGFPLPLFDGADVMSGTRQETKSGVSYHVVAQVDQQPAVLAEFYSQQLEQKGFKPRHRNLALNGMAMAVVSGQNKTVRCTATAMRKGDEAKTTLTIVWQQR